MDEIESETFQQQAFEVKYLDETFDPTSEPQSGEEFLMKVVYERKNCPAIVTKHPEIKNITSFQPTSIQNITEINNVEDVSPTNLRPTNEWKDIQIMNFTETQNKINDIRDVLKTNKYSTEYEFPLTEEEHEWRKFCQINQPLLSIILRINQRSLERLLELQSEWLNGYEGKIGEKEIESEERMNDSEAIALTKDIDLSGKDEWLGSWIYSTLACLYLPLEPRVHSILRDIARTCIRLRNKLGENDETKAAPYNLLISIICKVFAQLDLGEFI